MTYLALILYDQRRSNHVHVSSISTASSVGGHRQVPVSDVIHQANRRRPQF